MKFKDKGGDKELENSKKARKIAQIVIINKCQRALEDKLEQSKILSRLERTQRNDVKIVWQLALAGFLCLKRIICPNKPRRTFLFRHIIRHQY